MDWVTSDPKAPGTSDRGVSIPQTRWMMSKEKKELDDEEELARIAHTVGAPPDTVARV